MHHAPSGDLSHFAPEVVAGGTDWHRATDELYSLLQQSGFLDRRLRLIDFKRMAVTIDGPARAPALVAPSGRSPHPIPAEPAGFAYACCPDSLPVARRKDPFGD
jgi:hypothetical protein